MVPELDLNAAQVALDRGQLVSALASARAWLAPSGREPALRLQALRVRAVAAFRLGELGEAADAAGQWLAACARDPADDKPRLDVLGVSVVAAGELARYEQALEHLRLMLGAASRAGSLADFVRGRGTAAILFALLGDPWAAQRLLSELAGMFQAGAGETRLEATVRNNHASVCLQTARLARLGGDASGCEDALEHAQASIERARELLPSIVDPRGRAFAHVHAAELKLLRGEGDAALELLADAVTQADTAQLWAHARQLRLLEAEVQLLRGDTAAARRCLAAVAERLDVGHELGARVRCHEHLHRVHLADGELADALAEAELARALGAYRQYRQSKAQSQHLRTRLELEHLYRYRGTAARSTR
ncbi:MAG TPA: hypothetical protein VFQ20_11370 [Burkholderiaceae bacterium]|nr:hypothetical protein [Burkholderiaceae bacterium]